MLQKLRKEFTIRQKQRIGARQSKYARLIEENLSNVDEEKRFLIMDLISHIYENGLEDGILIGKGEI